MTTKICWTIFFLFLSVLQDGLKRWQWDFFLSLQRYSTPLQHGLEIFATLLIYLGIKHKVVQHNRSAFRHDIPSPESNLNLCHESLPWIPLFLSWEGLCCNSLPSTEYEYLHWFWKSLWCAWRQAPDYASALEIQRAAFKIVSAKHNIN